MKALLKHKNAFLVFSLLLMSAGIVSVIVFGFRLGIDFTSGSLWQLRIPGATDADIREFFRDELGIEELNISFDASSKIYSLAFREISDAERQSYFAAVRDRFGEGVEELDFLTASPSVSEELRQKSITAIWLVLFGISLYIAFAFRKVSEPIRSWKYGVVTLVTLLHDVAIPAGVFAILGATRGIAIDINFVVAMLFVVGFSVHDTIVVFDRIRENLLILKEKLAKKINLEEVVDKSVLETLARSVNTSLTLIAVLLTLYFLGPISIRYFILAILIGTVAGTYSSIFFASPLLTLWERFSRNSQS